ncbi:MAG TPA: DNA repair protein RecN [Candidatus Hydrogenedentes bacterium]|nr:DNA repair protein RecN [Candidatus Hydrogenedentota bacterium]
MLETLRIQQYALIEAIEVDFRQGFNVLTGETGAGKSIVVGALTLVLGARASGEVVRAGAVRATIEAVFRLPKPPARLTRILKQYDIALEDGCLLLSRTIGADGRSRAYAGGNLVPIAVLAEIGDELVDLHGQHEHQSLLKTERQLELLDAFGGTEEAAQCIADKVAALHALEHDIAELDKDDRERARQLEFLRYEVHEIDAAGLHPGEEEELRSRHTLITNAETIFTLAHNAYGALYENEEGAAIDALDAALRDLEGLSAIDPRFKTILGQLSESRNAIEAVSAELRGYTERLEFDPQELDTINRHLALIGALKRKFGGSIEEILAYRDKAAAEISAYESRDERLETLKTQRAALGKEAQTLSSEVSKKRKAAARKLDKQVVAALQDLGMKGAHFQTIFEACELCAHGVDRMEFFLAANTGEKPKPLRQVASGGEISRIMLALKAVFAQADKIPSLIFDEIDAGVGGVVARKVADKLEDLSRSHQVICITHIAQIAASAETHMNVLKETVKGRNLTRVIPVEKEARVAELARLLDGSVSEVSLKHARALLAER